MKNQLSVSECISEPAWPLGGLCYEMHDGVRKADFIDDVILPAVRDDLPCFSNIPAFLGLRSFEDAAVISPLWPKS